MNTDHNATFSAKQCLIAVLNPNQTHSMQDSGESGRMLGDRIGGDGRKTLQAMVPEVA